MVVALVVSASACRGFVRPGATRQEFYRDLIECRQQRITGADIGQAVMWGSGLNNARNYCMGERGWELRNCAFTTASCFKP